MMGSTTPPTSPTTKVQVKKEEEIKDYAETAMNELLGWYGYERLELRRWAASRARDNSSPEQSNEQKNKEECSWCNKNISIEGGSLQHAGAAFCSELCFSQSRRANFKRAKTCDWCRHVRHTVAYVDFQDGATQLQFCSDKCLNQYKMHIFCRETQAHLDLNPHLIEASSSSNLITPELWLKNCKSRSVSPTSELSVSPKPENMSKEIKDINEGHKSHSRKSPPIITVAPTAKLLKSKGSTEDKSSFRKSPEARKELKSNKMSLRKRRTSKCSATVTSQTIKQQSTSKAQDLRTCSPSIDGSSSTSTLGNTAIHSPSHSIPPSLHPPFPNPVFGIPPPVFLDSSNPNDYRLPNMFPPRHFLPRPGMPIQQERPRIPPPLHYTPPIGQVPPVTVLVPYPVVIPIPLPIPIPIPITTFIQAHGLNKIKTEAKCDDNEGPLDFTMNSERKKETMETEINKDKNPPQNNDEVMDQSVVVNDRLENHNKPDADVDEIGNPENTLPKFKITRVGNKVTKVTAKPRESPESNRPLRKRRRLVEVVNDDDSLIPKTRKIVQV